MTAAPCAPRRNDNTPDNAWSLRNYFRAYSLEAIEKVATLMRGPDPKLAIVAAQIILDRGWGKALQQVEVGRPGDFTDLTDEQLEQFIKETTAQITKNTCTASH